MFQYSLSFNDKCLCGSGKKYKQCCLKYKNLGFEDFRKEFSYGNFAEAYKIINSCLTHYLINVKRHTEPILNKKTVHAEKLLRIDIEAVTEIIEHIFITVKKGNIKVDLNKKIVFISNLIESQLWKERMLFFLLLYFDDLNDNNMIRVLTRDLDISKLLDCNLMQLIFDVKKDLSLSKSNYC